MKKTYSYTLVIIFKEIDFTFSVSRITSVLCVKNMLWIGTGDGYIYIYNILIKSKKNIDDNNTNNINNNQLNQTTASERPKAKVSKTKSICLHDVKKINKKQITFANKPNKNEKEEFIENDNSKKSIRKWKSEYLVKLTYDDDESSEDQNRLLSQILKLSYSNLNSTSYNDDFISKYIIESERMNDNNSIFSDNKSTTNDYEELINNNYISDDLWSGSSRKSWIWDSESINSHSNNTLENRLRSTNSLSCNESFKINSIFPRLDLSPTKTSNLSDNDSETTNFFNDEDDDAFLTKKSSPKRKNQINRFDKSIKGIF